MPLMPVAEARTRILDGAGPLGAELVPVEAARARVLAEALAAKLTQPPFAASSMDGYAARARDIAGAPVCLRVIGAAAAGHGFEGRLGEGEAVRIFTGAPLPDGADTVVIQENACVVEANRIEIRETAPPGRHVRPLGYDFSEGETLLAAGLRLNSRHLMLAAAMNHARLRVRKQPVVAIMPTGDELVPPGARLGPHQIVSSIPSGIAAAIEAWGGTPRLLSIARDSVESLAARIGEAEDADILLTLGGASAGEHDLVRTALEAAGVRFTVLKIAMRPGKPVMFGLKGRQRVLCLPGNPVSALIGARVFLKPLIGRLLGLPDGELPLERPLAEPITANGEREHYMRAQTIEGVVTALADQDSSLMRALASADCLIVRPPFAPALPKGALVPVIPLDF